LGGPTITEGIQPTLVVCIVVVIILEETKMEGMAILLLIAGLLFFVCRQTR
jgi:hypothetical protein